MNLKVTDGSFSPSKYNKLVEAVNMATVKAGVGYNVRRNTGGTVLDIERGKAAQPAPKPFELRVEFDDVGDPQIRVYPSTLAEGSSTELGFSEGDDPPYFIEPTQGILQGKITIDESTGEILTREILLDTTLNIKTATEFYIEIGSVSWSDTDDMWKVNNSRFGPINALICRNWYVTTSPFYNVTFS